ncbi:MAG TPA: response regulator transcription factor [Bacteroidota bacterium]|nr:response regulator transcription factor [Bacteroidota bacterium]
MEQIRVLIADDHRDFRRAVHEFLCRIPNVSVVGEAEDGNDAVEQVGRLAPDVVLMDIRMPNTNGLEATRIIKERWPKTRVLIATQNDDVAYRMQAQEAHADGFIVKSDMKPVLVKTFGSPANRTAPR